MTTPAPSSTQRSWLSLILEVEPDWQKKRQTEPAYEFSNGRIFQRKPNPYSTP